MKKKDSCCGNGCCPHEFNWSGLEARCGECGVIFHRRTEDSCVKAEHDFDDEAGDGLCIYCGAEP